jgi:dimethylglycine dehydrogenase
MEKVLSIANAWSRSVLALTDEVILKDGDCVGYVSFGGDDYHAGKSMAMGYVPAELAVDGMSFTVEVGGAMCPVHAVAQTLHDANGSRMRS